MTPTISELKKQLEGLQSASDLNNVFFLPLETKAALLALLKQRENDEKSDSDAYDADEKAARAYLESDEFNCSSKDTYTAACQHIRTTVVAGLQKQLAQKDELLKEADFFLMMMEDYTHGEEGKTITLLRKKIQSFI